MVFGITLTLMLACSKSSTGPSKTPEEQLYEDYIEGVAEMIRRSGIGAVAGLSYVNSPEPTVLPAREWPFEVPELPIAERIVLRAEKRFSSATPQPGGARCSTSLVLRMSDASGGNPPSEEHPLDRFLYVPYHFLEPDGDTVVSAWNASEMVGLRDFADDSADYASASFVQAKTTRYFPDETVWKELFILIAGRVALKSEFGPDDVLLPRLRLEGHMSGFPTFDSAGMPVRLRRDFEGEILEGHRAVITTKTTGGVITTDTIQFDQGL